MKKYIYGENNGQKKHNDIECVGANNIQNGYEATV